MRLTLRTLLAYMDNMLEPADAEALRAKIEESEFARILMARIEAAVRQPRLTSLPLDEKGLGLDANSIAQYLDNTLSPELVPELEQFLLQSDMQLAEVAACHQALASILDSEPIVSPELKHRVRCLGSPKEIAQGSNAVPTKRPDYFNSYESPAPAASSAAAQPHSSTVARTPAPPPSIAPSASMSDSLVMTDPLRPAQGDWTQTNDTESSSKPSRRGLRVLITLALAILLILATLQAVGPINRLQSLWTASALTPESSDANDQDRDDVANADVTTESDSTDEPANTTGTNNENPTSNLPQTPLASGSPSTTDSGANESNNNSLTSVPKDAMPVEKSDANSPASPPADTNPNATPNSTSGNGNTKPNIPLVNVQVANWSPPSESAQGHLLFARDEVNNQLVRITSATSFTHGTRLLIAPGVRNTINVNHDVAWSFYNATDVRVTTDIQMPWLTTLELRQGKAVLQDTGKSNFVDRQPQTLLRNGNTLVAIRWSEPNSAVAVEATPLWIDPTQYDPQYVGPLMALTDLRISVLQGKVEFSSMEIIADADVAKFIGNDSLRQKIAVGDSVIRNGVDQWDAVKIDKAPAWVETPLERPIDRQAASDLMQILPPGARANLVIVEALQNRRAEIAAMAAQTLILSDDFSFLVGPTGMLNDDRFRSHWTTLIDAVRERISTSPESFEALKASIAAQDVQRGALLFQVLVGYSEPELKLSAAERLVNLLESEYLDERILAIYHLKRITGKDLGFQPDRPSRGIVQDWKRLWRSGGITPK
jgi:hypothetical protein